MHKAIDIALSHRYRRDDDPKAGEEVRSTLLEKETHLKGVVSLRSSTRSALCISSLIVPVLLSCLFSTSTPSNQKNNIVSPLAGPIQLQRDAQGHEPRRIDQQQQHRPCHGH